MKGDTHMKKWISILGTNIKGLFKHPILYFKAWIKDFKENDLKGKIKKIFLTILGIYVCYEAVAWIICIIIVLGLVGGADHEVLRGRFVDNHGREPDNDYELYNDYNSY